MTENERLERRARDQERSAAQALAQALGKAGPKDCVLVCGSLYLIGETEKILKARQKMAE